jgi:hypothetical protein
MKDPLNMVHNLVARFLTVEQYMRRNVKYVAYV